MKFCVIFSSFYLAVVCLSFFLHRSNVLPKFFKTLFVGCSYVRLEHSKCHVLIGSELILGFGSCF